MTQATTRDRLIEAAFRLFSEQGFEQTTVEHITSAAGVGRTTFFRTFASKESVVFPDHDQILAAVDARLASASAATATIALIESATIVLDHYLAEGDVARERYKLTRTFPALRAAETASLRSYHRVFREHAAHWGHDPLTAELLAACVVTSHNHVLRRWFQGLTDAPRDELGAAITRSMRICRPADDGRTRVLAFDTSLAPGDILAAVRNLEALGREQTAPGSI